MPRCRPLTLTTAPCRNPRMVSYGTCWASTPSSWRSPLILPSSPSSCMSSSAPTSFLTSTPHRLSWADTAASTFGRLYGSRTPPLPKRLFGIFPLAPRKSLAGFTAATLTGAAIAMGFWTFLAPVRQHGLTWSWQDGVSQSFIGGPGSPPAFAGWVGLLTIGVVAGLVTGIAEALGTCCMLRVCASTDGVFQISAR